METNVKWYENINYTCCVLIKGSRTNEIRWWTSEGGRKLYQDESIGSKSIESHENTYFHPLVCE